MLGDRGTTTGHFLLLTFIRFISRLPRISKRRGRKREDKNAHQSRCDRETTPGDGKTDAVCRSAPLGILLSPRADRALRDGEAVKPGKIEALLPAGLFKIKHLFKHALLQPQLAASDIFFPPDKSLFCTLNYNVRVFLQPTAAYTHRASSSQEFALLR